MLSNKHFYFALFFCCCIYLSNAQIVDSIQIKTSKNNISIDKKVSEIKGNAVTLIEKVHIPTDSLIDLHFKKGLESTLKPVLRDGENIISQLGKKVSLFEKGQFISDGKASIEVAYRYLHDTSGLYVAASNNVNGIFDYNIQLSLTFNNIPFNTIFRGSNCAYIFTPAPFDNFFKFNFDPKKYAESLSAKVLLKVNPELIAAATVKKINSIRLGYEKALEKEIVDIKENLQRESGVLLELPEKINDLTISDLSSLKSMLLPASQLEEIQKSENQLQNLINTKSITAFEKDSTYLHVASNVKKLEALEKIYSKITTWKQKFENNKVVSELKEQLPFSKDGFKSFLSKPGKLENVIRDHAKLSQLQTVFMKISKLDLGKNPVAGSVFEIKDVVNTGINTEIKSNKLAIGGIYGKNNSVNNWLNAGLTSSITNEYSKLAGMKFGSGKSTAFNQSLSLNLFEFNDQLNTLNRYGITQSPNALPLPSHKDAVLSINTEVPLAAEHHLVVSFSKSLGSFSNTFKGDSNNTKSSTLENLFGNDGISNYAVAIDYSGHISNTEVTASLKKVGLGYSNPGSALLHRGETNIGLGLNRKVYKNKVTIKYKGEVKVQNFDPSKNYSFITLNNKIQVNAKLDRYTKIGLICQRSDYVSSMYGSSDIHGGSSRFQMDGAYRIMIKKIKLINNFMISHQKFNIPVITGENYTNGSFMYTHVSSAVIGKNLLSISLLGSNSSSQSYFFNTSFLNIETNYSYSWKSFKLGSSVGYYSNAGWNKQVGVKQQLSVVLGNKLSLDVEVGAKIATSIIRTELANQLYTNSQLHYNF